MNGLVLEKRELMKSPDLKEQLMTLHSHLLDIGEWLMEGGTEVNMPEWYNRAMESLDEANKITYRLMKTPRLNTKSSEDEYYSEEEVVRIWSAYDRLAAERKIDYPQRPNVGR